MNKYQEALDILYNLYEFESCNQMPCGDCIGIEYKEEFDALKELVEKATPKKVIVNGIREGRQINTVSFSCPSCNNHIGRDNFCKYCGQALDWSIEDE